MKYAIYYANGKRVPNTICDTRSEAMELYMAMSGDPIIGRDYKGAYVDTYTPKTKKNWHPFGL